MKYTRSLRMGAFAALALAVTTTTPLKADTGDWYINGSLGFQFPQTIDINPAGIDDGGALGANSLAVLNAGTWQYRPTAGMSFRGAVGMHVRPNIRVEGELDYLSVWDARGKGIQGDPAWNGGAGYPAASWQEAPGEFDKTRLMFSALYDFNRISEVLTPFVGLGLGYSWVDLDNVCIKNAWPTSYYCMNGDDGYFTYALHAGANLKIRENLSLSFRYTLSNRESMNFKGYELSDHDNAATAGINEAGDGLLTRRDNVSFDGKIDSGLDHAFSVGLTYKFGQPRRETYKN